MVGQIRIWVLLFIVSMLQVASRADFRHPGLLHSRSDLDRMKQEVQAGAEPWQSGFERFKGDRASQKDYRMRGPGEEIGRSPSVNSTEFDQDANAAYQCALMWTITGDRAYAAKALEIVNAWSKSLKRVSGRDAVLMGGLGPFKMVNAAEILRYTDTGWSDTDIRQCEQMFLKAIYPCIQDFALFANGNWDIAAIQTVMAIGVFCNDRAVFERGLRFYIHGAGDGCLTHYVIDETGQCQESGRDQQHTQLGLALLSACCEIAWHQGLDLFAYADYRLLAGFEYTAKYNLGSDVPFRETLDRTGKYHHTRISPQGRGRLRAVYEQVFHHYVNRVGMEAPYTQKAAEQVRPEGPGRPSADHPGFGTLLFSRRPEQRDPVTVPGPPGGLVARGALDKINLTWVAAVNADRYTVKRALGPNEPFITLAENVTNPAYVDTEVQAGQVYTYCVSAANASDRGPDSCSVNACAGLPVSWSHQDVGVMAVAGSTQFDGQQFTLEGAGRTLCTEVDQMQFVCRRLEGDGVIVARYVPQLSSQFTRMGLFMRESVDEDSPQTALLVTPSFGGDVEAPGWYARVYSREKPGQVCLREEAAPLRHPYVIQGRLLGACWLRLERRGDIFKGAISGDGQAWTPVGQVPVPLNETLLVGLGACSGLDKVTTVVKFDHVTVSH